MTPIKKKKQAELRYGSYFGLLWVPFLECGVSRRVYVGVCVCCISPEKVCHMCNTIKTLCGAIHQQSLDSTLGPRWKRHHGWHFAMAEAHEISPALAPVAFQEVTPQNRFQWALWSTGTL